MMRMTHKLAFATACLVIFSAVVVKPANAIDNNLSAQSIAQSSEGRITQTPDSSQNNEPLSNSESSDDSWLIPFLWGLGGYLVGSMIGTQKTYTKMNKGDRKNPPFV